MELVKTGGIKGKKTAKKSKEWGQQTTKEDLLRAFEFEVSQALKSYFNDRFGRRQAYHFQRDYTDYIDKIDLQMFSQKIFGTPRQKLKVAIYNILVNELKVILHIVAADVIVEFLFKPTTWDVGILEKYGGGLRMKFPKWNGNEKIDMEYSLIASGPPVKILQAKADFIYKDTISAIISTESRISKNDVCVTLSLPPPVNESQPHGLVIFVKMKDEREDNKHWSNLGTIVVPDNDSVCRIEYHVQSLYELWKKKVSKGGLPLLLQQQENSMMMKLMMNSGAIHTLKLLIILLKVKLILRLRMQISKKVAVLEGMGN
jgi:hypothetical protein